MLDDMDILENGMPGSAAPLLGSAVTGRPAAR
jgi:hypothetical protein